MHDGAWIAFSGVQKVADLNMIGITASASKNKFNEWLKEAQKRNVDAIILVAADAVNAIEWAAEKGLIAAKRAIKSSCSNITWLRRSPVVPSR